MIEETWRTFTNHKGYEVSDNMRWKNIKTKEIYNTKDKKSQSDGRIMIHIKDDNNKDKSLNFGRVVALAFVTNPDNKPKLWHIDKNLSNNKPINLIWCTTKEINDMKSNPNIQTRTSVLRLDKTTGKEIERYDSLNDASQWVIDKKLGTKPYFSIVGVCIGTNKTAYGYKWKYPMEDKEGEEWKAHPTIKNHQFSNYGRIKNRYVIKKGQKHPSGYTQIEIKGKTLSVHVLISQTFLDNPDNLPEVDHINRDRSDNRVCNLRWVTHKQNVENAFNKKVYQYSKDGRIFIAEYESATIAGKETNIQRGNISCCALGKRNSAGGFYWTFTKNGT